MNDTSKIVKIKCVGDLKNKLHYVKTIKFNTSLSLMESKDFCEKTLINKGVEFILPISTSIEKIENDLREIKDSIQITNKKDERQIKLISLGICDESDLIEYLSSKISSELVRKTHLNNNVDLYYVFNDYMLDFLKNFNKEKLKELFEKFTNLDQYETKEL